MCTLIFTETNDYTLKTNLVSWHLQVRASTTIQENVELFVIVATPKLQVYSCSRDRLVDMQNSPLRQVQTGQIIVQEMGEWMYSFCWGYINYVLTWLQPSIRLIWHSLDEDLPILPFQFSEAPLTQQDKLA